jgi:hypothetical protein
MNSVGFIPLDTIVMFNRMQHLISYAYYQLNPVIDPQTGETEDYNYTPSSSDVNPPASSGENSPQSFLPVDFAWAHQFVLSCITDSNIVESRTDPITLTTSVRLKEDWDKWIIHEPGLNQYHAQVPELKFDTSFIEKETVNVEADDGWELAGKKKTKSKIGLPKSNPLASSLVTLTMNDEDLFQFDESYHENDFVDTNHTYDISDFEDEDLDSILLITQRPSATEKLSIETNQNLAPRKHATSPFIRSKSNVEVADMISEGLFLYEKSFGKAVRAPGIKELGKVGTVSEETFLKMQQKATPIFSPKQINEHSSLRSLNALGVNNRFFEGGTTAASPPIGWFMDKRMRRPPHRNSFSSSYEPVATCSPKSQGTVSNYCAASSIGRAASSFGASFKELTPFQHPSYELLQENGFIQHKYSKYHSKAIRGNHHIFKQSERQSKGIGHSQEMNTLYRFWSHFLRDRFSRTM